MYHFVTYVIIRQNSYEHDDSFHLFIFFSLLNLFVGDYSEIFNLHSIFIRLFSFKTKIFYGNFNQLWRFEVRVILVHHPLFSSQGRR